MYNLTEKQFNLFKEECKEWIERFHLENWRVDFYFEKLNNQRARIDRLSLYVASITLSNETKDKQTDKDIKDSAKHEVIHLLLGRFAEAAWKRCLSEAELLEAEEELVRKLDHLIIK